MTYLSDAEKAEILKNRLTQFANEKYQHELNLKVGEASDNTELIEHTAKNIELINTAIVVHEQALASLELSEEANESEEATE
jgi:Na+/phosphate symporter